MVVANLVVEMLLGTAFINKIIKRMYSKSGVAVLKRA